LWTFDFAFGYKYVSAQNGLTRDRRKRMPTKKKKAKSLKKPKALAHTKPLTDKGFDVLKLKPW
jgi:hypothetical protein